MTLKANTNHALDLEEVELDSEAELMRSMGLPLRFGGQSARRGFVVSLYMLYLFCLLCLSRCGVMYAPQLFLRVQFVERYLSWL